MRPYLALAAAVLACAAAATPSSAQELHSPYCATFVHGDTGSSSHCTTQGPPPVLCAGCGVRRTVELAVVGGAATALLHCDGYDVATVHVDGPGVDDTGVWGGINCDVTVTATADGTTAAVTSTASYTVTIG